MSNVNKRHTKEDFYTIYEDILFIYLNHYYRVNNSPVFLGFHQSRIKKIVLMIRHFFVYVVYDIFKKHNTSLLSQKIAYYAISKNTLASLKFLENTDETVLYYSSLRLQTPTCEKKQITSKWRYVGTFFKILPYFSKKYPEFTKQYFDVIFYSCGYYESFVKDLEKDKPKAMIFSNDHNYDCRALLHACKTLNIPTIYIQHAAVNTLFPPLAFNLNLLEGQDSLEKYQGFGAVHGEVKLIGMPKFDPFFNQIKSVNRTVKNIGVAFNMMDKLDDVCNLLLSLLQNTDYTITVRAHPRETRNIEKIITLPNLCISTSNEDSFAFLSKQDAIIAGSSTILLEACLLNIIPIYYAFNNETTDTYGFVKNGLADVLNTNANLSDLLKCYDHDIDVRNRSKFYNATVNSDYDGKSTQLAWKYLHEFFTKFTH